MLFQAVITSIFFSLLTVFGNAAPSTHGIMVAVSEPPCSVPVAKGEGPPLEMTSSILLRQWAFSRPDDAQSDEDLLACGAADGGEEDEVCEVPDLKEVAL